MTSVTKASIYSILHEVKKKGTRKCLFWLLVYKANQPRSCGFLGRHCKVCIISWKSYWSWNFEILECICVCIYEFCLIYSHRLLSCRLYYLTLSKPWQAHYKTHFGLLRVIAMLKSSWDTKPNLFTDSSMLYGGPGGSRTRVQNAFTLKELQLYAYYSALYLVCQVNIYPYHCTNL